MDKCLIIPALLTNKIAVFPVTAGASYTGGLFSGISQNFLYSVFENDLDSNDKIIIFRLTVWFISHNI